MGTYIIRRFLQAIPLLFIISLALYYSIFSLGDPIGRLVANNPRTTQADIDRVRALYGLDKPKYQQYLHWAGNFVRGNWGQSLVTRQDVRPVIWSRLKNTLLLMVSSFVLTLLIAIPTGLISALKQYSTFDYVVTGLSFIFYSLPVFFLGFLMIYIFSLKFFQWGLPALPAGGMYDLRGESTPLQLLKHLILPAFTIALISAALYTRYLRSSVLEIMGQDYVRTARAKGLRESVLIRRHVMKNAALPLVTLILLQVAALFSGAVVTESIFAWPGMGSLFIDAARNVDYPILMAILVIASALVILFNLIADVVYAFLDPRIKYS
jgi:peptide/nickel transport system permease protein